MYAGLLAPGQQTADAVALIKFEHHNGFEEGTLAYGRQYLSSAHPIALNPAYLPLSPEVFAMPRTRTRDGGALHLSLQDALPDAWGRLVIQARNGWQTLSDIDVLLQTNADRVGAIVFTEQRADLPSLDLAIESFSLEELAQAAHALEFDMDVPPSLRRLLNNGGSLGGARPKASIVRDGALWIAKFPAKDDELDVQLIEACTLALARLCGIQTPDFELVRLGKIHTLLLRRFDRPGKVDSGGRIHFLSAAAFTNSPYDSNAGSYVKLAQHLRKYGANVAADLSQLFRRMVFNMAIDNSDDHVKNHGVLHAGNNLYVLSPAYDLVPQLTNLGYMSMAIVEEQMTPSLALARSQAGHFGLSTPAADQIIAEVLQGVGHWCPLFESMGVEAPALKRLEACLTRQQQIIHQ